jgi:hypothetical protein
VSGAGNTACKTGAFAFPLCKRHASIPDVNKVTSAPPARRGFCGADTAAPCHAAAPDARTWPHRATAAETTRR